MKYNIVSAKSQEKSTHSQSPIVITQRLLPKQNCIIIGSAGSGKTTRISEIYAELINDGVKPDDIACIAFNRSVAYELAGRISAKTDLFDDDLLCGWVTTFHALCKRLLGKEFNVKVLEPHDAAKKYLQFIKETIRYREIGDDERTLRVLINLYDLHKETKVKRDFWSYCRDYMQREFKRNRWCNIDNVRRIYQRTHFTKTYKSFCEYRFNQDIVFLTFYELLMKAEQYIDMFRDRFKYILLDESQDISPIMWSILDQFNATKIYVGDRDQSIYLYRNASPTHFLSLPYRREVMPYTYRFDTDYMRKLEHGIALLSKNRQRKDVIGKGGEITIHNRIPERIENGVVLGRTNRSLEKYSTRLARMLIPHVFEEFTLYGTKDHNPLKDRFAVIRVFLESKSITEFVKKFAVVIADQNYNELPTDQKVEFLKQKYKDEYELFTHVRDLPLTEKVKLCLRCSRLRDQARALLRVRDLEQFLCDLEKPRVILSTVHRYKGREADNIYIPNFDDGLFPLRMGNFEEEARVCYVALSRVKKNIYVQGNSPFRSKFLNRR